MGRDIVGLCAHVNLLIDVNTGNDEENTGSTGSAGEEATQAENDCSFIFLSKSSKLFSICDLNLKQMTWTTFTERQREKGRVMKMRRTEMTTRA